MTNQSNACKFVLVNLDNYLLVQESDWWHLKFAQYFKFSAFTPTCVAATPLTVAMEKSLTSAH